MGKSRWLGYRVHYGDSCAQRCFTSPGEFGWGRVPWRTKPPSRQRGGVREVVPPDRHSQDIDEPGLGGAAG